MPQQIVRFSVGQTAIVIGVIYALMGILAVPVLYLVMAVAPAPGRPALGGGTLLAVPLIYGAMGFVVTVIGCVVYNMVASWVGGIEVELERAE